LYNSGIVTVGLLSRMTSQDSDWHLSANGPNNIYRKMCLWNVNRCRKCCWNIAIIQPSTVLC